MSNGGSLELSSTTNFRLDGSGDRKPTLGDRTLSHAVFSPPSEVGIDMGDGMLGHLISSRLPSRRTSDCSDYSNAVSATNVERSCNDTVNRAQVFRSTSISKAVPMPQLSVGHEDSIPIFLTKRGLHARLRPSQRPRYPLATAMTPTVVGDRFISPRKDAQVSRNLLMSNKPYHLLNDFERRYRRQNSLSDPFGSPPRVRYPSSDLLSPPGTMSSLRLTRHNQPHHPLQNQAGVLFHNDQFSNYNSLWSIGGPAIIAGTPESIMLPATVVGQSHSSAPRYRSQFLEDYSPREDIRMHKQRLAVALGIDRANRIFDFAAPSETNGGMLCDTVLGQPLHLSGRVSTFADNHWMYGAASQRKSPATTTVHTT